MCAILDTNVLHQVFGDNRVPAGDEFRAWLDTGKGTLVSGGKNFVELTRDLKFKRWAQNARLQGTLKLILDEPIDGFDAVDAREQEIFGRGGYRSNDPHVIALAQISDVRLLYSNDGDLIDDFKDKRLLDRPRGKVYSTNASGEFTRAHKNLLARKDLCKDDH